MSDTMKNKLEKIWNSRADEYNQWCELGIDEQLEFSALVEREECEAVCIGLWHQDAEGSEYARSIRQRSAPDDVDTPNEDACK